MSLTAVFLHGTMSVNVSVPLFIKFVCCLYMSCIKDYFLNSEFGWLCSNFGLSILFLSPGLSSLLTHPFSFLSLPICTPLTNQHSAGSLRWRSLWKRSKCSGAVKQCRWSFSEWPSEASAHKCKCWKGSRGAVTLIMPCPVSSWCDGFKWLKTSENKNKKPKNKPHYLNQNHPNAS